MCVDTVEIVHQSGPDLKISCSFSILFDIWLRIKRVRHQIKGAGYRIRGQGFGAKGQVFESKTAHKYKLDNGVNACQDKKKKKKRMVMI